MDKLYRIIIKFGMILFTTILTVYALVAARTLLYPIVISILFSYLLYPIGKWLEKHGCHRILANCMIIFGCLAGVTGVGYILYSEARRFLQSLPELRQHAEVNVMRVAESITGAVGIDTQQFREWMNVQLHAFSENGNLFFDYVFPSTIGTMMGLALVPVYIFLFLFYRNKFYNFLLMIWPEGKKSRLHKTVDEISQVTRRYMSGVFTVVLILGFVNTLGLYLLDVKFALLLGIVSALCNFIPYFGVWIGAIFPLSMAIFTGNSPQQTLGVLTLYFVVDLIENNILTPSITGGSVQVNPLMTIIGIIAAGMIWGIPGMFVVIPLLGMLKIIFENSESTRPLAFLIGTEGTGRHSVTMKKIMGFFKRQNKNGRNQNGRTESEQTEIMDGQRRSRE